MTTTTARALPAADADLVTLLYDERVFAIYRMALVKHSGRTSVAERFTRAILRAAAAGNAAHAQRLITALV